MSSPVDENVLNQLKGEQSDLLDKIDELRTIGVGGLVELPQIVVCGNQSSGKSSVLEAISRVRFPAKSNVCTRFATEIVLRRHAHNRIKVSIEPGNSREDAQEREKLRAFTSESFSSGEDLPALIESAKECMGLSSIESLASNSGFSDDVLKVEISGPDRPELTLVDLPGLYYSTSSDQGESGMNIVQSLTENYMESSRTIILAVISARNDFHIQKVLDVAQKFDPKYERVLGIVTQPDIPGAGSDDEEYYLQLVGNEKVKLQLGWHVLRNRSFETANLSDDARDAQEKDFFERGRWASLPREQVAIESLRYRLSTILLAHIRRNLPGLIVDIQDKIFRNERALATLGISRASVQEQRRFLVDISSKFARITNQALNGSYVDKFFGGYKHHTANTKEFPFRRLRAIVRELNECFAHAMTIRGSRRIIHLSSSPPSDILQEISKPYMDNWTPKYVTRESLKEEIKDQARENRGIELPGTANQLLVGSLFRDQCEPWKKIAEAHILNVWSSVEYFVQLVLKYLIDDHTRVSIMRHIISPELEKMKERLMVKLEELSSYYNRGHPLPVGDLFLSKIQESRKKRQLAVLAESLGMVPAGYFTEPKTVNHEHLKQAADKMHSSSDEFGAEQIIDQMQAYYDTTIITFVENVAILAIENCLLFPLENVFSSQTVVDMDDEQLQRVATEPSETQKERTRLNEELDKLRRSRQTLDAYKPEEISLPKPPNLGLPTPQTQAPRSVVYVSQRNAQQAPAKNTAQGLPPVTVQKTQFAQSSPSGPPPSGKMIFGSADPAPSSQPPKYPPSSPFAAPTGQGGAMPKGFAYNNVTSGGSSLFGKDRSTSPSQPKSGASSPPGRGIFFGTSSAAPSGAASGGSETSPFGFGNNALKNDATKPPKTQGFTHGFCEADTSSSLGALNYYQHICSISPFSKYSPEELRLGDYL